MFDVSKLKKVDSKHIEKKKSKKVYTPQIVTKHYGYDSWDDYEPKLDFSITCNGCNWFDEHLSECFKHSIPVTESSIGCSDYIKY